jgi:hypothetical protein
VGIGGSSEFDLAAIVALVPLVVVVAVVVGCVATSVFPGDEVPKNRMLCRFFWMVTEEVTG